jgi:hypothetical protein
VSETFLWRSVGVAEWSLLRPMTAEEIDDVGRFLRSLGHDVRVHRTDSGYIYWSFFGTGVDEPTRLRLQPQIAMRLDHLFRKDVEMPTLHWDGVRVRADAVRALNDHVQ